MAVSRWIIELTFNDVIAFEKPSNFSRICTWISGRYFRALKQTQTEHKTQKSLKNYQIYSTEGHPPSENAFLKFRLLSEASAVHSLHEPKAPLSCTPEIKTPENEKRQKKICQTNQRLNGRLFTLSASRVECSEKTDSNLRFSLSNAISLLAGNLSSDLLFIWTDAEDDDCDEVQRHVEWMNGGPRRSVRVCWFEDDRVRVGVGKYAGHFALRDNLFVRTMARQKPDENGKASCWPVVKMNLMLFSQFIHNLFEVVFSDWRVRSGYFSPASSDACHHPCSIRKSVVSEWREDNDATRPLSSAIIWVLADECGLPHELGN